MVAVGELGPLPHAVPLATERPGTPVTTFTLTANDPSGGALTYGVAFGDGGSTSGTITSPYTPITITHTYQKPGTFNAGASITDTSGDTGSSLATITATGTIPLQPKAGEAQEAEVGVPATLNGTGSQPSSSITSYQWNFGDGSTGSGAIVAARLLIAGDVPGLLDGGDGDRPGDVVDLGHRGPRPQRRRRA